LQSRNTTHSAGKSTADCSCKCLSVLRVARCSSTQEPLRMRGLIKAQKILTRLGAEPDVLDPFPEKPPRMHWRTYRRLYRTYAIARDGSIQGVMGRRPS